MRLRQDKHLILNLEEKVKNTQLQVEVNFLKNLAATGNICEKLEKIKPEDKYKVVHHPSMIIIP